MGERCTVEGTVQSVIFQNEENGYTVLSLLTELGEVVTAVGCIPYAAPGEGMTVTGVWVTHPLYGRQITCEHVERRLPREKEEMVSYLASGLLKGVGQATAEQLVAQFGADTLRVLEEEPEKLSIIRGITDKKAVELSRAFRELTGLRRTMEFMARYDLPVHLAVQAHRIYGTEALNRLREDPYLLTGQQFGVEFSRADEMALSMGFDGDSGCRIQAALLYELQYNQGNGHVFLPREKLIWAAEQLIGLPTEPVEICLDIMVSGGAVCQEQVANVLAGLVRCGNCGHNMQRMGQNKCDPRILCTEKGCIPSTKYDLVVERFMESLERIRDDLQIEVQQSKAPDISGLLAEQSTIAAKLKKAATKIDTLHDLLEDGTYDRATYKERMAKAEAEQESLLLQQADVEQRIQRAMSRDKANMLSRLTSVLQLYPTLDNEGKNQILKSIVNYAVYRKSPKSKPGDFTLEIILKDI